MKKSFMLMHLISALLCVMLKLEDISHLQPHFFENELVDLDLSSTNITIIKSETEVKNLFIDNFDVSDFGKVLLCLEGAYINVYNADGSFDYSLSYNYNASSVVFWSDQNIVIYTFRDDKFIYLDDDGNIIRVCGYTGDKSKLINTIRSNNKIAYQSETYELVKDNSLLKFSNKYDTLIRTKSSKDKQIIYAYYNSMERISKYVKKILILSIIVILTVSANFAIKKRRIQTK